MSLVLAVDADRVSAGPLGLLVVVLMILATVFLIRNMNARLKRLPREFPDDPRTADLVRERVHGDAGRVADRGALEQLAGDGAADRQGAAALGDEPGRRGGPGGAVGGGDTFSDDRPEAVGECISGGTPRPKVGSRSWDDADIDGDLYGDLLFYHSCDLAWRA